MPRPKLNPTDEQRRKVKSLAAMGTPHDEIAKVVNIRSAKTLRKHFRLELDQGATEANAIVGGTLFQMAKSGDCPAATIFWMKCRAGWKERSSFEPAPPAAAPPFIVTMPERNQQ